jgi:serine/threonine-protein kinase
VGECVSGYYHLHRLLGRGGMSYVFEAHDSLLSRKVAIKVADDAALGASMLVREAKALAAVRHSGLPAVYGLGVHHGWSYMVLERLFGVTLEQHLEIGSAHDKLPVAEAVAILTSIADVLAAVHRAGMAHRDLKPGNVMLCSGDRVVLLDFGIVLPEVEAKDMARCGTPRYLAPEIITGAVSPGSAHLVDVYAFGTMAFEMLVGRVPFVASTLVEQLEHHLRAAPPDLASLRADLPASLCTLIMSCLAKAPADRPAMETILWELRTLARRKIDGTGPVRVPPKVTGATRETYRRKQEEPTTAAQPMRWDILIIEDDEDIREGLASVLNARGCRTSVAPDGRAALDLMRRRGWRPQMILLDLMMPVMDGQGFLESQAGDPCLDGIPVVLLTAQPSERARQFATVRGVVPKPFDVAPLLALIGEVCKGAGVGG